MKTLTTLATALLSAAVLIAAAPAHADAGHDQYRRVVLGDATVAAPAQLMASPVQRVPGPYAQYLISIGSSTFEAITAAARIGESTTYRAVALNSSQRQLTAAQAYAKHLGNDSPAVDSNEPVANAE